MILNSTFARLLSASGHEPRRSAPQQQLVRDGYRDLRRPRIDRHWANR